MKSESWVIQKYLIGRWDDVESCAESEAEHIYNRIYKDGTRNYRLIKRTEEVIIPPADGSI